MCCGKPGQQDGLNFTTKTASLFLSMLKIGECDSWGKVLGRQLSKCNQDALLEAWASKIIK
jgi:hypothetical protein